MTSAHMQHTQSETEQHFSNILLPEFPRLQVQGLRIRGGVGADTNWARQEGGFCHWQMPRISKSLSKSVGSGFPNGTRSTA